MEKLLEIISEFSRVVKLKANIKTNCIFYVLAMTKNKFKVTIKQYHKLNTLWT